MDSAPNSFYVLPPCHTSFYIDLSNFTTLMGSLAEGQHTITMRGYYECNDLTSAEAPSRTACFSLQSTVGSPWRAMTVPADSDSITFELDPAAACDVGPCDNLHFIQVIRMLGITSTGDVRSVSWIEQYACKPAWSAKAESLDALTTGSGDRVDMNSPAAQNPYETAPQFGGSPGLRQVGGAVHIASWHDRPMRPNACYPSDVVTYFMECEVNALCAAGEAQGQWLGRCTWTWRRPRGLANSGLGACEPGTCDRSQPSAAFLEALSLFSDESGWQLPKPIPPTEGNGTCP
ncbi:MAG TPA: hypothetical protein VFK69_07050 [Candidatus Eisenbacteria bacterium]|nr:hypothetical protein [Candidatus Eisenbacteria bacterium]